MTLVPVLLSFLPAYAGLGCLALTLSRHRRQVGNGAPRIASIAPGMFSVAGWALLIISLLFCLTTWGVGNGIVMWVGVITLLSLLIILLLSYAPNLLPVSGLTAAGLFAALLPVTFAI